MYGFELTFQKVELFKVVSFDTSYGGKMAFISFMGGEPPYKREPETCMVLNSVFGKWNFQQLSTLTPIMEEGWFSFDSWEENPLINGNPKVVRFPTYFSESAPFQSILLWHHLWWKDGFLFIHGRRNPLLTRTQKLYGFEVTFREVKLFTVISFDTTYGGRMAFISFTGGEPPYKREL